MTIDHPPLAFIDPHVSELTFPLLSQAWDKDSDAPGLLAIGGDLSPERLKLAYKQGIFPWFGDDDPIMWWSPDPRMVLYPRQFKFYRSLSKTLRSFLKTPGCEICIDCDFAQVIDACSAIERKGEGGTWIVPAMRDAYKTLHQQDVAHSFETWANGELIGGLYGISIGGMFYGESMFSRQSNASKLALCGLVAFARYYGIALIDCQQKTAHLTSLGGYTIARDLFVKQMQCAQQKQPPNWQEHRLSAKVWATLLP